MPQGDKSKYTARQKRMAEHIEQGYESRGIPEKTAEARAWATVNKKPTAAKKAAAAKALAEDHGPARRGGRIGGAHSNKK